MLWWASPIVFVPRIPDFLSRFVALSKFMRLSLRESRTRAGRWWRAIGNPGNAGANVGHPYGAVGPATGLRGRPAVSRRSVRGYRLKARCYWDPAGGGVATGVVGGGTRGCSFV